MFRKRTQRRKMYRPWTRMVRWNLHMRYRLVSGVCAGGMCSGRVIKKPITDSKAHPSLLGTLAQLCRIGAGSTSQTVSPDPDSMMLPGERSPWTKPKFEARKAYQGLVSIWLRSTPLCQMEHGENGEPPHPGTGPTANRSPRSFGLLPFQSAEGKTFRDVGTSPDAATCHAVRPQCHPRCRPRLS